MRESYPLCLLDVLFCDECVLCVEYGYLTALDLASGARHDRQRRSRTGSGSVSTALDTADHVHEIPYDEVRIYECGWMGRRK
jgi:hypothetical protein